MNKCAMINVVTITGRINTCKKYILVTVCPDSDVPANIAFATHPPISGVEVAIFIPMVAAPNARLSQGKRYPEYPKNIVKNINLQNSFV